MLNSPIEQDIRSSVDEQLRNLGWIFQGRDKNVFQEQPRETHQKKKLKGKRPDYVLYSKENKDREEPLIIIETKRPGSNLYAALDQGNWYAEQLQAPLVFATDGIYYKTLHSKTHKPLILNGEEVDELIRELEALKFLENNEVDTISKEVKYDRQQLIKIFEEANNLLRDEGLRAGIERFGEFSNILFLKLVGEIEDLKEEEGRGQSIILEKYLRWNQWKNKKGGELLSCVNGTVLPEIGRAFKDEIFSPLSIKNPRVLEKIIDKIEPLKLINIDSDIKGDSFEYFLKQSTATKNDLGEYFTPRHIVKTMVKLVNPQFGERIYDPFCGTGGMLIETFRHIYNNMPRNPRNSERLKNETIFGNEITSTARITKMNMILIGDGHSGIRQLNSLENPVEDQYDAVITNMPYSQKTEHGSCYDLPSTNGDSICVQHCIKAVSKASEKGRMAIIVPEGFLFRRDMQKTREYLLDRCYLKSVISLPQGVFLPYTGVKTNILYCTDIKKKKSQDKFWYFDVQNDGYSLDSHRRRLEGETGLQKFLAHRNTEVQEKRDVLSVGFSEISMEEVKKNDLVLSGNRYKKVFDYENSEWEVVELGNKQYFEIQSGGTPNSKNKEYWNGHINWATLVDLPADNLITELVETERKITEEGLKNSSAKLLPKNSVLVSSRATIGRVALLKNETSTNQGFKNIIIKQNDKVNAKFLAYMMIKLKAEMEQIASGGTFKEISKQNFEKFKIPLPPIKKQQEIVDELNSYQKIIEGARQIIDSYKTQIEIDEKWEIKLLIEVADVIMGQSPEGKYYNDTKEGLPFYQGKTDFGDIYLKEPAKWTMQTTKEAMKHDILMSVRAPVGPVNISTEKICIGRGLCAIRPNSNVVNYLFLFHYLGNIENQISSLTTGSTFQAINKKDTENIKIPVPTLEEQEKIVQKINNEMEVTVASKKAISIFNNKIQEKLNFIWGK